MSDVAKEFRGIGRIIQKRKSGIQISEAEKKLYAMYHKECERRPPGRHKIIADEQKKILAEWNAK